MVGNIVYHFSASGSRRSHRYLSEKSEVALLADVVCASRAQRSRVSAARSPQLEPRRVRVPEVALEGEDDTVGGELIVEKERGAGHINASLRLGRLVTQSSY